MMESRNRKSGIPVSRNHRSNMKKNLSKSTDLLFLDSAINTSGKEIDSFTLLEENIALKGMLDNSLYFVYFFQQSFKIILFYLFIFSELSKFV